MQTKPVNFQKHEKTTGGKSCIHQIKPIMQDAQKEVNDQQQLKPRCTNYKVATN